MIFKGKIRFQNQLLTLLALGIIAPVSIVSVYSIHSSNQALTNSAFKQMQLEGRSGAKTLNTVLETVRADVLYLSGTPPVQGIVRARDNQGFDPQDKSPYTSWVGRLNTIFTSFLQTRYYYDQLRYLDENGNEMVRVHRQGNVVEVVSGQQLQNKRDTDYFKKTMNLPLGEVYVSSINLNRENGKIEFPYQPVIRYSVPIFNQAGKRRGILIANILVDPLFKLGADEVAQTELQQQYAVVNRDGYYLYHPDSNKTWGFELNRPDATLAQDFLPETSRQILAGGEGFIRKEPRNFISYQTVFPDPNTKANSFTLLYQTPKQIVLAPINNFKMMAVLISLLSLAMTLFLGFQLLQQVMISIQKVLKAVTAFSEQLLLTVDEQERAASQQATAVSQTTSTMNELGISSHQSANQAEAAETGARQVLALVSANEIQTGNQASLKARVNQIAEQILQLSEQTSQIGMISSLVSDLANQTNMLALNAAVEAVRAGEHGKGFAVVAAEIRRLAEQSRESANRINGLVSDIQNATNSTVMVTDEGTKTVDTIVTAIGNITNSSQQISLTAKQQAIAIQQVVDAMGSLNQAAHQTASGIAQTKASTQQLMDATVQLKDLV